MTDFKKLWKREKWYYLGIILILCAYSIIKIIIEYYNQQIITINEYYIPFCQENDVPDYLYGLIDYFQIDILDNIHFVCSYVPFLFLLIKCGIKNLNYSLYTTLPFSKKNVFWFDIVVTYISIVIPTIVGYITMFVSILILRFSYMDCTIPLEKSYYSHYIMHYADDMPYLHTLFVFAITAYFMLFRQICKKFMEQLCVTFLTLSTLTIFPFFFWEYFVYPLFHVNAENVISDYIYYFYNDKTFLYIVVTIIFLIVGYIFSQKPISLDYEFFNYKAVKTVTFLCVFLWSNLILFIATAGVSIDQGKSIFSVILYSVFTLLASVFITGGLNYVFRRK